MFCYCQQQLYIMQSCSKQNSLCALEEWKPTDGGDGLALWDLQWFMPGINGLMTFQHCLRTGKHRMFWKQGESGRFWPAHLEPRLWMAGKAPLRPNQLLTGALIPKPGLTGVLIPKPVTNWGSDSQTRTDWGSDTQTSY